MGLEKRGVYNPALVWIAFQKTNNSVNETFGSFRLTFPDNEGVPAFLTQFAAVPRITICVFFKFGSKKGKEVAGYIGNGSDTRQIVKLRSLIGEGQLIWTPGINFSGGEGEKGQRYGHPREAIIAGSDAIIVGSGIHCANSPAIAAKEYADAGWSGLLSRD